MGSHRVTVGSDGAARAASAAAVADDLDALEALIDAGRLDDGPPRLGAEQEMLLVDRHLRPAPVAALVLARLADRRFTAELARFNLEANATPRPLAGASFTALRVELDDLTRLARFAAAASDAEVLLAGFLPSYETCDAGLHHMTASERFRELDRISLEGRGGRLPVTIRGTDALELVHDSIMLEGGSTSFQVHLQVPPAAFATTYNAALLAAAPVLAACANSSVVFGRRLWHETRVPLLEASADLRDPAQLRRPGRSRTSFGDGWVERSALELFQRDLARFPPVLAPEEGEPARAALAAGRIPALRALTTFNGTVWRWLRPCYGVTAGRPHLRIENRFLAAGPTVLDEVANAALWIGLVRALPVEYGDPRGLLPYAEVEASFHAAARSGLDATLRWVDGARVPARELLLGTLLPLAREGLLGSGVDAGDVEWTLGLVRERVATGRTGAAWALAAYEAVPLAASGAERAWRVTDALRTRCWSGQPVHAWPAEVDRVPRAKGLPPVSVALRTDVCSVLPDAPLALVARLLRWAPGGHVVVEHASGEVAGVLCHSDVAGALAAGWSPDAAVARLVATEGPLALAPSTPVDEALATLRVAGRRCAAVVRGDHLAGVVYAPDLVAVLASVTRAEPTAAEEGEQPLWTAPSTP
jgi:CBS domain-containing protein